MTADQEDDERIHPRGSRHNPAARTRLEWRRVCRRRMSMNSSFMNLPFLIVPLPYMRKTSHITSNLSTILRNLQDLTCIISLSAPLSLQSICRSISPSQHLDHLFLTFHLAHLRTSSSGFRLLSLYVSILAQRLASPLSCSFILSQITTSYNNLDSPIPLLITHLSENNI